MIFQKRYRYRFGDIDHAGIAYYPALLHYFHVAFEDWWADGLGTPYPHLLNVEKLGLPSVHLDVDFVAPIRYGDEPEISLGVLRIGTSSVEFGMWMQVDGRDRANCKARITTAAVDMDSLTGRPLPDRWRAEFEKWALDPAGWSDL